MNMNRSRRDREIFVNHSINPRNQHDFYLRHATALSDPEGQNICFVIIRWIILFPLPSAVEHSPSLRMNRIFAFFRVYIAIIDIYPKISFKSRWKCFRAPNHADFDDCALCASDITDHLKMAIKLAFGNPISLSLSFSLSIFLYSPLSAMFCQSFVPISMLSSFRYVALIHA